MCVHISLCTHVLNTFVHNITPFTYSYRHTSIKYTPSYSKTRCKTYVITLYPGSLTQHTATHIAVDTHNICVSIIHHIHKESVHITDIHKTSVNNLLTLCTTQIFLAYIADKLTNNKSNILISNKNPCFAP